jgi:hypothetical protein
MFCRLNSCSLSALLLVPGKTPALSEANARLLRQALEVLPKELL